MVLLPTPVTFAIAMASGVSGWLFVHPADVVKVSVVTGAFASVMCARLTKSLHCGRHISLSTLSFRFECSSRANLEEAWC